MLRQKRLALGAFKNESRQKNLKSLILRSLLYCMVLIMATDLTCSLQLPSPSFRSHALNVSTVIYDLSSIRPRPEEEYRGSETALHAHPSSSSNEFSTPSKTQLGVSTIGTGPSSGPLEPNHIAEEVRTRGMKWIEKHRARLSFKSSSQPSTSYQWTKQNLAIALPALMGLLADPLLSMVDTGFVGRSAGGATDLAALGVCTSIFHMAFTVFRASTVATTSLVGSASTPEEKRQVTQISLGFAGVMGTLVLLALRLGGGQMLTAMGVSPTSPMYKSACNYLFTRCWAAPAVVGIVVAEGAFRGNGDNKSPLVAASIAAVLNLVLDPLLMFTFGMGMTGAAAATAASQLGAAGLYAWRLVKRNLLPQPQDQGSKIKVGEVLKSIIGANAAMLSKNFSMLVFYTAATSVATRIGAAHVATHQVCLSLFWLTTMWLDSGGVSAQLLLSRTIGEGNNMEKINSLTKYMVKFALAQGLAFTALLLGAGKFLPTLFTQDATVIQYMTQCLPHIAIQQTIVSIVLVLEGLAVGGNQFRFTAGGTAFATAIGVWQLLKATSVFDIWATAVNTFFGIRILSAVTGVVRVHMGLRKKAAAEAAESSNVVISDMTAFATESDPNSY